MVISHASDLQNLHCEMICIVERPIKMITHKERVIAIKATKSRKAAGHFELYAKMISTSGVVGISVMMELCQRVLDGKRMLD